MCRCALALVLCLVPLAAQSTAPLFAPKSSAAASSKGALDKTAFEAYLRYLLAAGPEVQIRISDPKPAPMPGYKQIDTHFALGDKSQEQTYYVSNDGQIVVRGLVYKFNQNPFAADAALVHTEGSPMMGTPGAPLVMVEYSDFECPNCKEEAKVFRDNLLKTFPTQVRFYFRDFPIVQIHPWSKPAAMAGRCVFHQNAAAFWDYHDWMFEHQGDITADNLASKVTEWAQSKSLNTVQLTSCIDGKATEAEVDKEIAEGKALQIEGTPTTFLNGRRLFGNYPWPALEQIINMDLKRATSGPADEKCCEVPMPIKK